MVLQVVGRHEHRRLGARIRGPLRVAIPDQCLASRRDLDEELVVTDEGDHLLIAVECVLAKHLANPHVRYGGELVEDETGRTSGSGHIGRVAHSAGYYSVVQAELVMPPAQLGSASDSAMLHGSCSKFMHLMKSLMTHVHALVALYSAMQSALLAGFVVVIMLPSAHMQVWFVPYPP